MLGLRLEQGGAVAGGSALFPAGTLGCRKTQPRSTQGQLNAQEEHRTFSATRWRADSPREFAERILREEEA